jgi:hypothetical protein
MATHWSEKEIAKFLYEKLHPKKAVIEDTPAANDEDALDYDYDA